MLARNQFVLILVFAVWLIVSTSQAADRPNILWLIAEDFGPHLGCYGEKHVATPHLDGLAQSGVRYANFFTTAPVCSPSRSAFMTGMYQTTIGAHNHRSHRDDGYKLPEGVRVLTDWLRDASYFTANVRELPAELGFRGSGKTDWNFTYEGRPFDSDKWSDLATHQPFFAQVNFQETHRTFHAPKHADPANVEIPPYYPDHSVTREDWAQYLDSATELDRKIGLVLKQLAADGLADSTVVVFFGDNGQAHVRGKQFCYDSGLHVPLIIRWPKNFPPPKHFAAGTVDERLLASIDLAPTMLAIAGADKPAKMQGEAFLGNTAGEPRKYVFGARDRCDETVFRFRTVRTDRYRYIRNFTPERSFLQPNDYKERQYPVWNLLKELDAEGKLTPLQKVLTAPTMPAEELYDITADPHETQNLATSPDHAAVLKELRSVLEKWIDESNDQGREPESPEIVAAKGATKAGSDPNTGSRPKGKGKLKKAKAKVN
jgi:N-sulfoglucosamine sulfohydrolase